MQLLLGLGGNLGDPPSAFRAAVAALGRVYSVVSVSATWRSRPVGPPQPDYWNAAAVLTVTGSLIAMLSMCQDLERAAGRQPVPAQRWGPRPLDLDLLMVPGVLHQGPRLSLPHPELHRRAFVLVPAAELAGDWLHPRSGRTLRQLAEHAVSADPGAVWPARLSGSDANPAW